MVRKICMIHVEIIQLSEIVTELLPIPAIDVSCELIKKACEISKKHTGKSDLSIVFNKSKQRDINAAASIGWIIRPFISATYPSIRDLELSENVLRHVVFSHWIDNEILISRGSFTWPVLMTFVLSITSKASVLSQRSWEPTASRCVIHPGVQLGISGNGSPQTDDLLRILTSEQTNTTGRYSTP